MPTLGSDTVNPNANDLTNIGTVGPGTDIATLVVLKRVWCMGGRLLNPVKVIGFRTRLKFDYGDLTEPQHPACDRRYLGLVSLDFGILSYHMISRNLFFSSSPEKMMPIPCLASLSTSCLLNPKCCVTSLYSLESGLPNMPTSSVYSESVFPTQHSPPSCTPKPPKGVLTPSVMRGPLSFHHSPK